VSNKYQEIINLSKKSQEAEKSKGRKILELQGHEFNDNGDIVVDLITETNNGKKNFGKVTYDAYKAVKSNALDSYKPKNDEEKKVLDGYKKHTGLFINDSNSQGNTTNAEQRETSGYVPSAYSMTKSEYQRRQASNPDMPEFGSVEYFKKREEQLRPIMDKIAEDADRTDDHFRMLAEAYAEGRTEGKPVHEQAKELYNKFKYQDAIVAEYKDINSQLQKFEKQGVHKDDSGEIDTKSGSEEAKYAKERYEKILLADAPTNDEMVFGFTNELPEEKQKKYDQNRSIAGLRLVETEKEKAYNYYDKNKDNVYNNDYGGRFAGNYKIGRIGIKENNAGKASYDATIDDIEASDVYKALAERIQLRNKATFKNNGKVDELISTIGQYAPQGVDQVVIGTVGKVVGYGLGMGGLGGRIGSATATANYMYNQTAGATFVRLLRESDLSVEDAKKLAQNEALVSGGIEFGLELAAGKLWSKIGNSNAVKQSTSKLTNTLTNALISAGISEKGVKTILNVAKNAGKFALEAGGEGVEEWWQEGVSITADRYAKAGKTASAFELLLSSLDLTQYSAEDFSRMNQSFLAGAIIGIGHGGVNAISSYGLNKTVSKVASAIDTTMLGKDIIDARAVRLIVDSVDIAKESDTRNIVKAATAVEKAISVNKKPSAKDVGTIVKYAVNKKASSVDENATVDTETAPTEETSTTENAVVAENATTTTEPVVAEETTPVATEQRNTFTEELDDIANTEMPTVSVGETFVESGTDKVIKVVARDDNATTTEITTADGKKETKVVPNKTADTLAVDDKYTKVDTVAEDTTVENTVDTPAETATPQTKPSVKVGDVYGSVNSDEFFTVVSRDDKNTTVVSTLGGKPLPPQTLTNEKADVWFNLSGFTKLQDGQPITSINEEKMHDSIEAETENQPATDETVIDDKETTAGGVDLAEGEILSLKHTKNIYSLFKGAKNIVVGKDIITDSKVAIPLNDKNLAGVKKAAKDAIIQNNDNFTLEKLYNKDNDVVIQGEPKVTTTTDGQGYVFKIGDNFYVCSQKYIDAFNNGKNTIKANSKKQNIPWTVHDKNGNFVALFMGAKKSTALNDSTFENLQSVSEVLAEEAQKKAEKEKIGLNQNELRIFTKANVLSYGEFDGQAYITNNYILLAVSEEGKNAAVSEYEDYNSRKAVERDLNSILSKFTSLPEIGTVAEIKTVNEENKTVACVVNDIGFTFNNDFVNLLKKRGTLKVLSDGKFSGTVLVAYDENGICGGFALPITCEEKVIDGLTMFTGNGLPTVETKTETKSAETTSGIKEIDTDALFGAVKNAKNGDEIKLSDYEKQDSPEEVLKNQSESDTIEEKSSGVKESGVNESGETPKNDERRSETQITEGGEGIQDRSLDGLHRETVGRNDESRDRHISQGVGKSESRRLEEVVETEKFSTLSNLVGNSLKNDTYARLATVLENDPRLDEGYDFSDVVTYDMLADPDNELRALFADEIAEYFNNVIDVTCDITGAKVSTDALKKTKKSVTKNKHGMLIPLYHATNKIFDKFTKGDVGYHFGSYVQAYQLAKSKEYGDNTKFIKAYLNITNPLVIEHDHNLWNAVNIVQSLEAMGIISREQMLRFVDMQTDTEQFNKELRDMLSKEGYDGIVYKNEYESGYANSYIVFDDSQIIRLDNGDSSTTNDNKESIKNDESQSEVLAGESRNDGGRLHTGTSGTAKHETTERIDGQHRENSGEALPQSIGTDGNRPDDRNDSERVYRGNDADNVATETTGNTAEVVDEQPETIETEDKTIEKKRPSNKGNFVITDDIAREFDNAPPSADDNIKAIELLLTLENEGRPATAEEKKILAKYKGWGGIDTRRLPYELSRKLYDLYSGQQLRDMQNSQSNAFFTPTGVIDAMYNGLKRMGFKGGNVLETSMGVGNFFGRMPVAMTSKSALTGVELESYTARIAQYLYPGATVINKPFQDVAIRNGSYDLVIGNVPFGTTKISYNKKKYSLHNYFIISSLDKVKDGGVVAVITSASTLDSYTLDTRKAIMDRADVVACYKLPAGVFSRNASTDVQTDLLILRKRASDAKPKGDSILNVTTSANGLRLNEYFVKHPENVLGTLAKGTNAWGEITTVLDNGNFYDKLNNAMKKLPKDLISGNVELKPIETIVSTSSKPRFFEKNGKIYADDGAGTATTVSQNQEKTIRDYMAVRDAYKDLLAAYESDMPETEIKPLRDILTKAYDDFSKKHGAITGDGKKKIGTEKSTNNKFLEADSDYYLVSGLERYNKDKQKFEKSELFEKDTLRKKKVTSVDSASDALAVSLNESGKIDFARMSELTGKTEKQLSEELKGEIVLTPEGDYVLTDIYLSGNIYEKLEAVKDKPEFKEQKEMLEKVLPTPKDASSIMIKLGANYIDTKYIEDFSREVFRERISVSKNSSGAWSIDGVKQTRWGDILNVKYGCDKFNAIQLLEKVLNDSEIIANKKVKLDGKSVDVFDEKMTEVARQKAEDIKEAFENWIFKDSERRTDIVDKYNRTYNNYRPLDYERIADKLSFDSMNETLKSKLYPHQKKGIARFLFGGNILFAHGVGTGKTFEMIASVMEAKRMGIINKVAMVVPNNKVVDFKNDIAEAYPNAKVLIIDTADKKRQTMLGLVNSNDWDIVLIARTTFTKIPVSAELQQNYINQQLEDLDHQIMEAEHDRNISKRTLDGLKKQRTNLEQKLKDLDSETKRDENSIEFEKLGFDCICVDEAHNYKSITTPTKLDIKGLASGSDAQQANDMLMKLDYMRSIDGRLIFGTGTPITNTVAEIYNMMRMVRPDILENAGIRSLDEWVNTFANIETTTEIGIDNRVKNKSTQVIRNFVNVTEMVGMFRQFADVVFTQDVVKNLPKAKYIAVEIDGTNEHRQIETEISNAIANASGTETLKVYTKVMSMANAAAIDLKMLSGADSDVNIFKDYSLDELEYENSKINTMCNIVFDKYKTSNNIKGTQIIFCDGGAGSGKVYSFNVHNDIKQKLIERGIPENEIVIVKNQKNAQLEELYDKVNSGEVRVLIGTSRKMAEGLNVQKRVVAIHHPTVTYKPSDLEQGDARGVRAGNINEEVEIYRYLQGNTFDSYKWQAIDRKGAMINAALRGEVVDELEDIGADDDSDAGVDAATAMAITSGNPLVKEKIDIDKEVKRLKTLKQNFMNEYYNYQDAVAKNPAQIRQLTEYAQKIERDIALRNKYGDKAAMSIRGKVFEKQSDANKALIEAVKTAPKNGQFTKIGEYNGFDIMFKGDTGGLNYSLVVKGANEYSVEYAGIGNNIARIAGVLNRLDAELTRVQKKTEQLKSDLEFAKQEINKPFAKEKELTEALEKQKDITYRYEHFGESQSAEQTENTETTHSSRNVGGNSEVSKRWTTERISDGKESKNSNVNIADIVKMIRERFDIPIATGKVTDQQASGIYKERAESIRTRIANNLPTISHELGHHLDKKYNLSGLDSVKELKKSVSKDFLDQYPAEERNAESVAEFLRTYLQNTNNANRLCPDFYSDFISTLSQEDLKAVNEIANAVNEYMASGFSERVRASIVSGNAKERTTLSEKAKKMHAEWVDGFLPIKDAVEYVEETTGTSLVGRQNAYTLATNSLNARAIANFNTVHGFRDLNGNIVNGAKSYIECIADVDKKDLNTLDEYLVLKHSLEWIAPKQEDVTKKRVFADDTLEDVEAIEIRIAEIEYSHPEMKKAAENLYEYQRNILKYIVVSAGGMTEDTFNSLNEKYPCYVPFYRAIGKDGTKTKGSFANQKSPLKRAKGSGELILSPLESIIKNTDKMVKFALRNQTMQVLTNYANTVDGFGKFIEKVPPDMLPHVTDITRLKENFEDALQQVVKSGEDYFAVSDLFDELFGNSVTDFTPIANANKKIVTVLQNGHFSYYQVHDDALYDAIAEFTPKQLTGIFAISQKIMQPMKMLITQANPIFGTTNLLRDIGTAYKHSAINNPAEFAKRYAVALKEVVTKGDMYKQWQAMGGGHNSELSADLDQIKITLRRVAQKDMGKARRYLYSAIFHPIATTAAVNDYIESIPRVMEFTRTLETDRDLQQAIYNADDITTNFKKSGKGSLAKDINALVMFNNAALQGLNKTYRTLTKGNTTERNKTLLKWGLSALLMAAVQIAWNNLDDDDDYENLSSYKKNNFYNFSIGDGLFISIPKARETALLDSFTERIIESVFGNDEAFYGFGGYVLEQIVPPMFPTTLNPLDAAHDFLGSTVLGGVADVGWNKNYMDIPIEGAYDKYLPSNERYNENTTNLAYALGQTKLARKADMSPKKIDHLISSYTGIIGQMNKALFPKNKERQDITVGLRNKFVSDSNYSTDLLNKMYDNRDKAELEWQYDNNINNAIEYEKNAVITSYISGMNKAIKALPEDEQREGRKYLLKALNNWNYDLTTQEENMISKLEDESISEDYIFSELPSSTLEWTKNKVKYTYQMTPQEYNKYISDYLNAIENSRKKYGGNSLESYARAKEVAKDYMSKYKDGLKSKYLNKATKTK